MTEIPEEPERGAKTVALLGRIPKWVKDFSLVALILVIAWKIATAEVKFDLTGFQFTDVLALVLAIAAVGLSALFYFKATETSNRFYDNTYKFTKDISETLGRIEERFGAGLEHLHESYTGIQKRFEQMPPALTLDQLRRDITAEEEKKKKSDEDRERVIKELMERGKLEEVEKERVIRQLVQAEEEAQEARNEIARLERKVKRVERATGKVDPILEIGLSPGTKAALDHLAERRRRTGRPIEALIRDLPDTARAELVQARILGEDGMNLTRHGDRHLRAIAQVVNVPLFD